MSEAAWRRARTLRCDFFGMTHDEHDDMTFAELGVYDEVMRGRDPRSR